MGILNKLLTLWGRFCPVCNLGRLSPESEWGRKLMQRRNNCPACNAYRSVHAVREEEEESDK